MKSEPLAETMMLATATRDGVPSVRAVLLKGADANGFVFYTNLESRKAEELSRQSARGAVLSLEVAGPADPHRGSGRVRPAPRRPTPISRRGRATARSAPGRRRSRGRSKAVPCSKRASPSSGTNTPAQERVPRPANWSGYRVRPERFEFWQERPFRLHDRVVFVREGEAWRKGRLYP